METTIFHINTSSEILVPQFDASSKISSDMSLNILHVGPKLQQDLADNVIRWRTHKVVFTAYIENVFRNIKV